VTALPPGCIHRTGIGTDVVPADVTCEQAALGMKVIYRPYPSARPDLGVITELVGDRQARVLYLGDRIAKLTQLSDLHYWNGDLPS
jgi:hypothetical protein